MNPHSTLHYSSTVFMQQPSREMLSILLMATYYALTCSVSDGQLVAREESDVHIILHAPSALIVNTRWLAIIQQLQKRKESRMLLTGGAVRMNDS